RDVRLRQPLAEAVLAGAPSWLVPLLPLLQEELNVKRVRMVPDSKELFERSVVPNLSALGPMCRKDAPRVGAELRAMDPETLEATLATGPVRIAGYELTGDHVTVKRTLRQGFAGATVHDVGIYLNMELTPALVSEGLARDFLRRVQTRRKELGLKYDDRVTVRVEADAEMAAVLDVHRDFVMKEALADALGSTLPRAGEILAWDIEGHKLRVIVERSGAAAH
ncbi:MAG TPA: DUF5915 domain-containing protein, partial [Thermoplasmata archaeon]|nr:DUF5915 domain-containing protein [Thermoplasmata archaeon]